MEQAELEKLIGELEVAVDRVRSLYEQYFMGIEKLEPTVPRKDVDRRVHVLRKEQIRNTALRFRFHMLLQRYNTYQTHWQRVCRDIENGTYKRHVIRAQQRFGGQRTGSAAPPTGRARSAAEELAELDREFAPAELVNEADVELEDETPATMRTPLPRPGAVGSGSATPHPAQARPPRTPPPRPPRPAPIRTPRAPKPDSRPAPPSSRPAPSSPRAAPSSSRPAPPRPAATPAVRRAVAAVRPIAAGPSPLPGNDPPDDRLRQLYAQYLDAKRRQNESTATITYESVARSIRASSAKLRQRLGKPVDFEIAVKDGHAIIRPVVK